MSLKTYNAKDVAVVVGARVLTGFAADSKVIVARESDSWTKQVGVDGEVTRSKSNDKTGTITVTLMQTSDDNDYLSSLAAADELGGTGVVNSLVKDSGGRSIHNAAETWIRKPAESGYTNEAGDREWIIDCAQLNMNPAGN